MIDHLMTSKRLRQLASTVIIACIGLLCAGCPNSEPDSSAAQSEITEIPMGNLSAVWRAQLPSNHRDVNDISLSDDKVFVYGTDAGGQGLRCTWLDRASGRLVTTAIVGTPRDRPFRPVVLNDRVVFPSSNQLQVYDRDGRRFKRDGKEVDNIRLRHALSSPAVGEGNTIFAGVDHPSGGRLAAIDTSGNPYDRPLDKWYPVPNWELASMKGKAFSAAPAVYQGLVFAGSQDGNVYAVRGADRALLWPGLEPAAFQTGGEIMADLAVDKDGVYVSSMDGKLYCLNLNSGRINWAYFAGRALNETSRPVPTPTFVYVYVPGTGLAAIDKSGKLEVRQAKWIVEDARQFLAADDKFTYVRMKDNTIAAVDRAAGKVKFASRRNDFVSFATNVSTKDGTSIFAATRDNEVYCIRAVLKPGVVGEWVFDVRPIGQVASTANQNSDTRNPNQ